MFERNTTIIAGIAQLADSVANFKSIIADISTKAVIKGTIRKGASQTKTLKRIELESAVMEVSSVLFAFGHKTSNEIIKAISNIPISVLDKMRDTDFMNKANAILNTATENVAALEAFGLTAADITKLEVCISNYRTSSINNSGSKTESLVINKTLHELFQNGIDILDNEIDKIMNSLQTKEKNFYESYYTVRPIKHLGIRHKKEPEAPEQVVS